MSASGTETGTHFKIRDWDRDSNSKFAGAGTETGTELWKIRDWDRDTSKNPGPAGQKEQPEFVGSRKTRDRDEKSENPGPAG